MANSIFSDTRRPGHFSPKPPKPPKRPVNLPIFTILGPLPDDYGLSSTYFLPYRPPFQYPIFTTFLASIRFPPYQAIPMPINQTPNQGTLLAHGTITRCRYAPSSYGPFSPLGRPVSGSWCAVVRLRATGPPFFPLTLTQPSPPHQNPHHGNPRRSLRPSDAPCGESPGPLPRPRPATQTPE